MCRAYEETIMKVVRQKQHEQGDDRIIPLIMFDGGSFKHIWGTDMQHTGLLINYQQLSAPVKVDTAGGCIPITHQADLALGGHTFTRAIHPYMKLSLLSEGDLYVNQGWKFDSEDGRKRVTPPTDKVPCRHDGCAGLLATKGPRRSNGRSSRDGIQPLH